MKQLLACAMLGILTSCATAGEPRVFGAGLGISEDCVVTVSSGSEVRSFKPKFAAGGECRLVTHAKTTIPDTHFIGGKYIFFVENNVSSQDSCASEYTAIGISKTGELFSTDRIKSSRSCFVGRELHDYEYFAPLLVDDAS